MPGIPFGSPRDEVRRAMATDISAGPPQPRGDDTDCYYENSLQFSFEDGTLSFIEAAAPPPVAIKLMGIDTWKINGAELRRALDGLDAINEAVSEDGHNPIYRNNIITLWDLDIQYDHLGGGKQEKWGAIGIGDERYYKAICAI